LLAPEASGFSSRWRPSTKRGPTRRHGHRLIPVAWMDESVAYSKETKTFRCGHFRSIVGRQAMLAEMGAIVAEATRLLYKNERPPGTWITACVIPSSRVTPRPTAHHRHASRTRLLAWFFGGNGYVKDYPAERLCATPRCSRSTSTSQIHASSSRSRLVREYVDGARQRAPMNTPAAVSAVLTRARISPSRSIACSAPCLAAHATLL